MQLCNICKLLALEISGKYVCNCLPHSDRYKFLLCAWVSPGLVPWPFYFNGNMQACTNIPKQSPLPLECRVVWSGNAPLSHLLIVHVLGVVSVVCYRMCRCFTQRAAVWVSRYSWWHCQKRHSNRFRLKTIFVADECRTHIKSHCDL